MLEWLPETLNCCLTLDYPHIEVIIVDDASTDGTAEWVAANQCINLHYLTTSQCSGGPARPRNFGLTAAKGEFIQFLDADDLISPKKLTIQVHELISNPNASFACSDYRFFKDTESGREFRRLGPEFLINGGLNIDKQLEQYTVIHRFLFRKNVFQRIGLFDETLTQCEDLDLWMRLLINRLKFVYNDEPLAFYRERMGMSMSQPMQQIVGHIDIIQKFLNVRQYRTLLSNDQVSKLNFSLNEWTKKLEMISHP